MKCLDKEEKNEERIEKRKVIVHKIAVNLETAKNVVEKDKTGFFGYMLGFLKPRHEEIECESILLFYEPFLVAKANYYEKANLKNYRVAYRASEELKMCKELITSWRKV